MLTFPQSSLHLEKIVRTLLNVVPQILPQVSMSKKVTCQLFFGIFVYDIGGFLPWPMVYGAVFRERFNQVTNFTLPIPDIEVRKLHSFQNLEHLYP